MSEALNAALQAIDDSLAPNADESQQLVATKCRGLVRGYDARWCHAGYMATAVELILTSDLVNPATNAKSKTFQMAGKLDVIAEIDGQRILIDHKTTSDDITDPNAAYWRQLAVEGQVNHYMLLGWANGLKFDAAIWDVVRKPAIRPKKLSKADRTAIVSSRRYCGAEVPDNELERLQTEETESNFLYELRLAHDCMIERPGWYFSRRGVARVDHEIMEYAGELWQHTQDLLFSRRNGTLPPRNSGACMMYGSPCKFLGVCSGHDTIDSDRWRKREFVHAELGEPTDGGDGRTWLTNSRIRCFQTCRRKEFYQYQLGVEQHDEEEREALFFGTLWHVALEAWWLTFLKESDNGNANSSTGNGLVEHAAEARLSQ